MFDIFNILNLESDNESDFDNIDPETDKFKIYFIFLERVKLFKSTESVKCICNSTLSSKKTFSNHKKTCESIKKIMYEHNNYVMKFLPPNYDYILTIKSMITNGNFEKWFADLNSSTHKYLIKSSHYNSKFNCSYKTIYKNRPF